MTLIGEWWRRCLSAVMPRLDVYVVCYGNLAPPDRGTALIALCRTMPLAERERATDVAATGRPLNMYSIIHIDPHWYLALDPITRQECAAVWQLVLQHGIVRV